MRKLYSRYFLFIPFHARIYLLALPQTARFFYFHPIRPTPNSTASIFAALNTRFRFLFQWIYFESNIPYTRFQKCGLGSDAGTDQDRIPKIRQLLITKYGVEKYQT